MHLSFVLAVAQKCFRNYFCNNLQLIVLFSILLFKLVIFPLPAKNYSIN